MIGGATLKKPDYQIIVDGLDISRTVNGRLMQLVITENRGFEADTITLSLSDHDGALAIPPTGAELAVSIGWQGQDLVEKGVFIIDEVMHQGAPDRIEISGASVDLREGLPGRQSRSWHNTTVGALVAAMALEHGLEPVVSVELSGIRIRHLDQTDESDLNLLTRLAERHDALANVKSGRLLFVSQGAARTASGNEIPAITISREEGDQHSYRKADRDSYTGVKAKWNNVSGGKLEVVLAGSGEKAFELRSTYADEETALLAAQAKLTSLQRGEAELQLMLSDGRPELMPETPLIMSGWKEQIDETDWIAVRVRHSLTESGLISSIEAELSSTVGE